MQRETRHVANIQFWQRMSYIVLWVSNIPIFELKLFFINNLFGLSVSDFELHLSFN